MELTSGEEIEKAEESEYVFLQRRCGMMESDTAAFSGESRFMVERQLAVISKLRDVKHEVMVQLTVAKNPTNTALDDRVIAEIGNSLEKSNSIDEEINKRRVLLQELAREINRLEKVANKLRLKSVTDYQIHQRIIKSERKVAALENQLHAANQKYNKLTTENLEARNEIEHYFKARDTFRKDYRNLIGKLVEGKKIMMDLVELATLAYDQREEDQVRLRNLVEANENNRLIRAAEMADLKRKLGQENSLKTYLGKKGQIRLMKELDDDRANQRLLRKQEKENLVKHYWRVLTDIKAFCGFSDFKSLVELIVRREEENFALYCYTMDLNDAFETMHAEVDKLRDSIKEETNLESKRANKRNFELNRIQQQLTEENAAAATARLAMQSNREKLTSLLCGVEQLFNMVNGNNSHITNLLGENAHPNEHNFVQYMEVISIKTTEMMSKALYIENVSDPRTLPIDIKLIKTGYAASFSPVPIQLMAPTQPCAFCVETYELTKQIDKAASVLDHQAVYEKLQYDMGLPEFTERLHNLSACRQPRSRKILQRRYC